MKACIVLITLTIILPAIVAAMVLLPAGDAAQGHGGGHNFVIGGVGNPLAHWSAGGMDYSFHESVPNIWHSDINAAAAHLKDNTFATKLDYHSTSKNKVAIDTWPPEITHVGELSDVDTCDYAGIVGGDVACAWPVGLNDTGLWAVLWGGGIVENLYRVKIAFDPADVWDDPAASQKVVKGTTLHNPRGLWPSSRVEKVLRHEFGHTLGYFKHSSNAGDLMASPIGSQNLTDNDKWNLNRLYLYASDANGCFIDVPLKTTAAMRIGGGKFINGRFDARGAPRCPSTSWGAGSLAHYYKLSHDVGRSQGFEVSTINGGPTNVRQYIHNDDDNPYKSGAPSPFSANVSRATVSEDRRDSRLVQVSATDGNPSLLYVLKVAPVEADCIHSGNHNFVRSRPGRVETTGSDMLTDDACLSSNTNNGYSEFYGLSICPNNQCASERVTITLQSTDIDVQMYLRRGEDVASGSFLAQRHDQATGNSLRSVSMTRTLSPGEYAIEVTSYSTGQTGDYTLSVAFAAPAPAVPTGLTATPGNGSITLNWNDAVNATGYQVEQYNGSTHRTTASILTITGLTNGQSYWHRVRSYRGSAYSGWTSWVNTTLPAPTPAPTLTPTPTPTSTPTPVPTGLTAPTNVRATVNGSSVTVTWTDGANAVGHMVILFRENFTIQDADYVAMGGSVTFTNVPSGAYHPTVASYRSDTEFEYTAATVTVP